MSTQSPYERGFSGDPDEMASAICDLFVDEDSMHELAKGALGALKEGRPTAFGLMLKDCDSRDAAMSVIGQQPKDEQTGIIREITSKLTPGDLRNISSNLDCAHGPSELDKEMKSAIDMRLADIRNNTPFKPATTLKADFGSLKKPGYGKWAQRESTLRREAQMAILRTPRTPGGS